MSTLDDIRRIRDNPIEIEDEDDMAKRVGAELGVRFAALWSAVELLAERIDGLAN